MPDSERRVLIISPGVPHPTRGASTILFYNYIDAFRANGDRVLNILLLQDNNSTADAVEEYKERICQNGNVEVIACRAHNFILSTRFGHRLAEVDTDAIQRAIDDFSPDTMFCLDLMSAWFSLKFSVTGKRLVWLGDLNFQSYWHNSLYGWKEGTVRPWQMIWAFVQRHTWQKIYRRVLKNFNKVIVSSKSSEPALADLGVDSTYLPYPWPNPFNQQSSSTARSELPTFVFFGTLQALGSRSAFHFLIDNIYPLAVREFGKNKFRIKICGQGTLPEWAATKLGQTDEIEFLGFVDDLGALFSGAHAMIAPIDVPVGNRSRILTAMAARLFVIAHQNTSLGNPDLVDRETCFLAHTAEEFVAAMRAVFDHPEDSEAIIEKAFAAYQDHFFPDRATRALLDEIPFPDTGPNPMNAERTS